MAKKYLILLLLSFRAYYYLFVIVILFFYIFAHAIPPICGSSTFDVRARMREKLVHNFTFTEVDEKVSGRARAAHNTQRGERGRPPLPRRKRVAPKNEKKKKNSNWRSPTRCSRVKKLIFLKKYQYTIFVMYVRAYW